MRSGSVSESDRRTIEEICGLIDSRTDFYGGAFLQAALVRKNQGEWTNFFTTVSFVHKGTQTLPKQCLNYGSLVILWSPLKVEEGTTVLRKLVEEGELVVPELASIHLEGTF